MNKEQPGKIDGGALIGPRAKQHSLVVVNSIWYSHIEYLLPSMFSLMIKIYFISVSFLRPTSLLDSSPLLGEDTLLEWMRMNNIKFGNVIS